MKRIKSNKSPGPDTIRAEQLKASEVAMSELHHLLSAIWIQEVIPDEFALCNMLMHYKKKSSKDDLGVTEHLVS